VHPDSYIYAAAILCEAVVDFSCICISEFLMLLLVYSKFANYLTNSLYAIATV